jgi:hypothetical protein
MDFALLVNWIVIAAIAILGARVRVSRPAGGTPWRNGRFRCGVSGNAVFEE